MSAIPTADPHVKATASKSFKSLHALVQIFSTPQSLLTFFCLLFTAAGFIPKWGWVEYLAVLCGSVFALESMWGSIRERELDVNFLMVFAAIGAIAVGHVEDAAILLFLFSLSGTLESLAMARTHSAIEGLMKLRPASASLLRNSKVEVIPVEALQTGDRVQIAPFEAVPTDGIVVEGRSSIDQSAMTGESLAVARSAGDPVLGGTQNLEGLLIVEVTAAVGESTLDRIVALVADAQQNKASGERISQWFGQRYTFIVLISFVLSLIVRIALHQPNHVALYASLTLLVGMSPCALVISTPATTLSALAWAASKGLLIRGGEFIERAAEIEILAIDKTGTLTTGKPTVSKIVHANEDGLITWSSPNPLPASLNTLVALASAAEQYSSHPLAKAITAIASRNQLPIPPCTDARTEPGMGVSVKVDGQNVYVGRAQTGALLPDSLWPEIESIQAKGQTYSLMFSPLGVSVFGFEDTIRGEAPQVLAELRDLGIREFVMVTGDHGQTAETVAKSLGIETIHAGLLPDAKTAIIDALSKNGRVLMVGDGVNDAPSLALASVGVAMGGLGSEIALNAADVVLMNDRLDLIPSLIRLGRRTQTIVRTNLCFAAAMIVTLTACSLVTTLPLPLAVLGHEGSTVLVILNGLRLLRGPR